MYVNQHNKLLKQQTYENITYKWNVSKISYQIYHRFIQNQLLFFVTYRMSGLSQSESVLRMWRQFLLVEALFKDNARKGADILPWCIDPPQMPFVEALKQIGFLW